MVIQDLDCAVDLISLGLQAKFGDKDQAQTYLRQRSLYREILKICPPVFYGASEAIQTISQICFEYLQFFPLL